MSKATSNQGGEGGGLFARVANEILDSAEKLTTRLEEGINAMLTGEIARSQQQQQAQQGDMMLQKEAKGFLTEEGNEEEFDWSTVDLDAESPLSGMADSVMGDILQAQSGPQSFMEHWDAFRHAITWSEPFIIGILVFQLFLLACTIYVSRKNVSLTPRIVLMVGIAGLVRMAERINQWASRNWEPYCTQNYFDHRGIFVSIFLCAPLLLDSFIMLICFLREASQLLVQLKTAEIKHKRKQQGRNNSIKTSALSDSNSSNPKRRGKKDQ